MEGHTHNVATVCCHPELPIIMSGSEDGTLRIWHATTYRLENTLTYAYERCWSIAALKGTNNVAIGYDEGTICIQMGNEDPIASMDTGGKIVFAKHNEISAIDIKKLEGEPPADGERLVLASKELDVCEIYPQTLLHNSNGRFAVVTGDGEYIIYTVTSRTRSTPLHHLAMLSLTLPFFQASPPFTVLHSLTRRSRGARSPLATPSTSCGPSTG